MFSLVLLAALAAPEPSPAPVGGLPPTQMVASIDANGLLRLTCVSAAPGDGPGVRDQLVPLPAAPGPNKAPGQVQVKITTLIVTTMEIAAKHVEAYTIEGRPISAEKLATLLRKERSVLVAQDGKKVDPFLLQLYKDDTIVLVPPASALAPAQGGFGGPAVPYGVIPVPPPLPAPRSDPPLRKVPEEKPRPRRGE